MTRTRTAARQSAEDLGLGDVYPTSWKAFVGQDRAKEQLITAARSAKLRKQPMPHTLIASGTPGIGKTSLGILIGIEMGTEIRVVSGKVTKSEARMTLAEMSDGDILIIDEAHQLAQGGKANSEWLLHYLQDGVLMGPLGPEEQPKVTIVACTTDAGLLPETVRDRFGVTPLLIPYTDQHAAKIAQGMARKLFGGCGLPVPTLASCLDVARAASNNPRIMRRILTAVRDEALVHDKGNYNGKRYDLSKALDWLGLTHDGLTDQCQRYLVALHVQFAGEPAGKSAIADQLQEPGGLDTAERLLVDKGLIAKTRQGRELTQSGLRRAKELLAEQPLRALL